MSGFDPVEEIVALRVAVQAIAQRIEWTDDEKSELEQVVSGELRALNLGDPSRRSAAVTTIVKGLLGM